MHHTRWGQWVDWCDIVHCLLFIDYCLLLLLFLVFVFFSSSLCPILSFDFSSFVPPFLWFLFQDGVTYLVSPFLSLVLFSLRHSCRVFYPLHFFTSLLFSFLYPSFPFFSLIIMCVCVCSRISFDWSVRSFQGTYARTIIHPYLLVITYRTSYLFLFWCFTLLLLKGFYSFFFYI